MSKLLPVHGGLQAIVDDDVYEWASKRKWCLTNGYVMRREWPSGRTLYLHRLVMGDPPGMDVDHTHHNKLDCRREELRVCTHQHNQQSMRKQHQHSTSEYKGVGWHKASGKWRVRIKTDGKEIRLGLFVDEVEAAKAYDKAARELFGEFAVTNF